MQTQFQYINDLAKPTEWYFYLNSTKNTQQTFLQIRK